MAGTDFGMHVSQLRMESGYASQRSFAVALNVSNATVARIERGESEPTTETLEKMAELLGMEYIYLLELKDKAFKDEVRTVYDKLKLLDKDQINLVTNLIDQFLKTGSK